jgi:hypothetical protein
MKKLLIGVAVAAFVPITLSQAPAAHAGCEAGYVVGVPMSDGRLPVKCVPKDNISPGYVDGTGGNAQLVPGTGHQSGFKTTPYAQGPNQGDSCVNWHATTQDSSGQTLTCTHLPDSGHLMYWEYGGPQDS